MGDTVDPGDPDFDQWEQELVQRYGVNLEKEVAMLESNNSDPYDGELDPGFD